ncbi:MAG: Fic family protein [gamma proteobacterium endosymbiont of Lamellibrachia anaximandri]|nr:Fic family protein [gamma proteobacterium endosymbiont of Lamellibrachia anaximandri]MBL3533786.1 Fic family protein [gamma proteobacterium endosymbiont of Lamellibrachia anaximandri]
MMSYQPPFTLTNRMLDLVSRFSERLGAWTGQSSSTLSPMLRRGNRIRTIQASLEIEQNTLSVEQVSAVIEGKIVLGPPREIQEVKNAFSTYEQLEQWAPSSEQDLLDAHRLLMIALVDDPGCYRVGGVGVFQGKKLIHMAPPAKQVPRLMEDLQGWLTNTDLHPLLSSCLFHYEFEFIHPFSDGNGRMGRLWQTLILSQWRSELAWLPVETVVRDRQPAYYAALARADEQFEGTLFVEFMLEALTDALEQALTQNDEANDLVSDGVPTKLDSLDRQILIYCGETPYVTQEQLASLTGKSLSTIQRRIRKLRKEHLRRAGSDKSGYWKVISD